MHYEYYRPWMADCSQLITRTGTRLQIIRNEFQFMFPVEHMEVIYVVEAHKLYRSPRDCDLKFGDLDEILEELLYEDDLEAS